MAGLKSHVRICRVEGGYARQDLPLMVRGTDDELVDAACQTVATSLHAMTRSDGVNIRAAVPHDARPLARLHLDVWEDAYRDLMPADVFEERRATVERRVESWQAILTDGASSTTVAEVAGGLIGFASIGPPRDDDVKVDEELLALYVLASWWDRQVGHRLLMSTLAGRPAYLWVLRGNDRAIAFYRNHNFTQDGVTRTDEHGTELRMIRRP